MSSKGKIWLQWILIVILSSQFIGAAFAKLLGFMCGHFLDNGLSIGFMYLVGFAEAVTVVMLYVRAYRKLAVMVQMLIMIGAIYTHAINGQMLLALFGVATIGLLAIVLWVDVDRELDYETVKSLRD